MAQLEATIVFGLVTGGFYALAGLGLVVIYRSSRVLNFALPGIGTLALYIGTELLHAGAPYWLVFFACVVVAGLLSGATQLIVLRVMRNRSPLTSGIGTLGILLIIQGLIGIIWGTSQTAFQPAMSGQLQLGSLGISYSDLLGFGITAFLSLATLYWIYATRPGFALRATSAGPTTAQILGINTSSVQLTSWIVGGCFGGLAALFIVPDLYLDPNVLVSYFVVAFAAVVIGGFMSPVGVLVGGLFLGVAINVLSVYVSGQLTDTFTFALITLVLVFRPSGFFAVDELPVDEPKVEGRRRRQSSTLRALNLGRFRLPTVHEGEAGPPSIDLDETSAARELTIDGSGRRWGGFVWYVPVFAAAVVIAFVLNPANLYLAATLFATAVSVVGLGILAGDSGQLSLGQAGFMAIGAYTGAIFVSTVGWPYWIGMVMGVAAAVFVAFVVGILAVRLDGIYLAVFTLAFGLLIPEIIEFAHGITGGDSGIALPAPGHLGGGRPQYWFALGAATAACILVGALRRGKTGRAWRAVRDSQSGAQSVGYNVARVRLNALLWSAGLAGFGGVVSATLIQEVSPSSYAIFTSIFLITAVIIGAGTSIAGSLIGAAVITLLPYYAGTSSSPELVYGLVLLFVLAAAPAGLANAIGGLGLRARREVRDLRLPMRTTVSATRNG